MSERIPDLNPDGSLTGRVLAVAPDGRLVGIPEGNALKAGWRYATPDDVEAKKAEEAARKAAESAPRVQGLPRDPEVAPAE